MPTVRAYQSKRMVGRALQTAPTSASPQKAKGPADGGDDLGSEVLEGSIHRRPGLHGRTTRAKRVLGVRAHQVDCAYVTIPAMKASSGPEDVSGHAHVKKTQCEAYYSDHGFFRSAATDVYRYEGSAGRDSNLCISPCAWANMIAARSHRPPLHISLISGHDAGRRTLAPCIRGAAACASGPQFQLARPPAPERRWTIVACITRTAPSRGWRVFVCTACAGVLRCQPPHAA